MIRGFLFDLDGTLFNRDATVAGILAWQVRTFGDVITPERAATFCSRVTALACATRSEAGAPCPAIEVSAVADTPTDSTRTVTLNDTTTILISRPPLVATRDITGATASKVGSEWAVDFTVTDDAAKRVHEFTKQHVGSNLALVVDGKVHGGTPRIAGAITGNKYQIEGFNRADADRKRLARCARLPHSS